MRLFALKQSMVIMGTVLVVLLTVASGPVMAVGKNSPEMVGAAMFGNLEQVKKLVAEGCSADSHDDGLTALAAACQMGQQDVVAFLLDSGASMKVKGNADGIGLAAMGGHERIVQQLIQAGADVNALNPDGWSPLMFAVNAGSAATTELLLNHGADPNLVARHDWTALKLAERRKDASLISLLQSKGATH